VRSTSGYPRRFRRCRAFWQRGGASRTLEGLRAARNSGAERRSWLGFQPAPKTERKRGRKGKWGGKRGLLAASPGGRLGPQGGKQEVAREAQRASTQLLDWLKVEDKGRFAKRLSRFGVF
jgi:hypothetical protein